MLHIRYNKAELAWLLRRVIIASRSGRLTYHEKDTLFHAIASALEGRYAALWGLLPPLRTLIDLPVNGCIPASLPLVS